MIGFLVNIFAQVFSRILFNHPLSFTEEISRYAFLWMVMFGFSFATKYERHIRVTILVDRFPKRAKKIVDLLINLLALIMFCRIFLVGINYVQFTALTKTPSLQISRAYIAIIVPIIAFFMVLRSGERIVLLFRSIFEKNISENLMNKGGN
jgi:C4-dicarboxylate transporter DctQ subunit